MNFMALNQRLWFRGSRQAGLLSCHLPIWASRAINGASACANCLWIACQHVIANQKKKPVNRMVASVARKHHNYPNRKHESVYECTGSLCATNANRLKSCWQCPPPTCQRLLHDRQWSLHWRTCANACMAESLKEGPAERWRLEKEKWWPTKQNKVHDAPGRFVKLKRTRSKGERASTGRYQCLQMAILHYSCLIGSGRALAPILLALAPKFGKWLTLHVEKRRPRVSARDWLTPYVSAEKVYRV